MWVILIEVALKALDWFLDKAKVDEETKKNFYDWIKKAGADLGSVKLMEYGQKQLDWMKANPWQETK